jgi:Xaa-Pro aminopeptidase
MSSMDVPAGRPVAVPAAPAVVAKPTSITWLTADAARRSEAPRPRDDPAHPRAARRRTGTLKDGYGSDTSRTVHVGEPTDEERRVHDIVRRAQQAGFEAVRPGVACQEIDRAARRVIADAGYGEQFIHRTGHGIGLTTHEPPYMVEGETHPLEPGMCFSIEPGVYLPGRFGVRIEDIVTVTEHGGRRLNNTPHGLRIVS